MLGACDAVKLLLGGFDCLKGGAVNVRLVGLRCHVLGICDQLAARVKVIDYRA